MANSILILRQGAVDSSSDGIEFRNSDGELVSLSSNDGDDDDTDEKLPNKELTRRSAFKSPRPDAQVMYIQMEFCEKSTLRFSTFNSSDSWTKKL